MEQIEILFEYKLSKTTINCKKKELIERLTTRLGVLGVPNAVISLAHKASSSAADENKFILQRYNKKWDTFVDIDKIEAISDGDRLSVVIDPSGSCVEGVKKDHGEKAVSIIAKVKKPTEAEAKALAKYFPSGSSYKAERKTSTGFDPLAESVVKDRQLKKKGAIKRQRPSSITVVMMDQYCSSIPKGKVRRKLASKGKVQSIKFTRSMTHQEVKNCIIRAFKIDSFVVLDCDSTGHNLIKTADQQIDGEKVVGRKGGLYLCKEFNVVSLC